MEDQPELKDTNLGFFEYVFNFDNNNKNLLLNLFQYAFLAIPLVIIILKLANYYTPEEDDTKGTLEIIVEILCSVSIILLAIWFINKIIRYIPTYSKMHYAVFNETNFIIPLFIILFTMQTKLGSKINILIERLIDLYDGKTNLKDNRKLAKDYKTTQPIAQVPGHQPSRSDFLNNQPQNISGQADAQMLPEMQQRPTVQQPNFNNAYGGSTTPLVSQQQPQQQQMLTEPMAANESFGNMFGGSSF